MDSDLVSSLLESVDKVDEENIEQEFNVLRSQSSMLRKSQRSEAGALKENLKKNRYKDILPYDETRVVLSLETSESDGDYINASFIKGPLSLCIAAQAPVSSTLTDFWRMIWEYHVKVIVMACREFEMGKKKCENYWSSLNQTTSFGPFSVHCGESSPTEDIVIRELQVSYKQEVRVVTQLQFLSWPDHDVPHEASGVLDLLHRVWTLQDQNPGPKLVHCSAGCGRTGVICALDQIYSLLIHKKLSSDFSIMRIVLELRRQRPSSVQTKDQYQFIFRATSCLFRWFLQRNSSAREEHADSTQIYSNSLPQGTQKHFHLKKPQIRPSVPAPSTNRCDQKKMDVTYAVVNKNRSSQSESSLSPVATPKSTNLTKTRTTEMSHLYDNDTSVPPVPVYSVVRPRLKPHLSETTPTPLYSVATPTSPEPTPHYYMLSESVKEADDDYEDVTPSCSDSSGLPSANGIGFKRRIPKPRGPRDPPAEWTRLDR